MSESTLIIFATTAAILLIAAIALGIVVSRKFNDNEDFDEKKKGENLI